MKTDIATKAVETITEEIARFDRYMTEEQVAIDALEKKVEALETQVAMLEEERDGIASDLEDANRKIADLEADVQRRHEQGLELASERDSERYARQRAERERDDARRSHRGGY